MFKIVHTLFLLPLLGGLGECHFDPLTTPSGGWTLDADSIVSKDYFMRIDVDPGENYDDANYAPSSVYWAEYITFNKANGGYLGLQRANGKKLALASIWSGLEAKAGLLSPVYGEEDGDFVSIKGEYDWKVGHKYRFRVEVSPRTKSDEQGDWWMITLADLTRGTVDILGELKTPKWEGLKISNNVFLEYFSGPFTCTTLRHSRTTESPIKGNYSQISAIKSSDGNSYDVPHPCDAKYILPGMVEDDYGSSSWDTDGTLTLLGNNYRGLHQWGNYQNVANQGMMFCKDLNEAEPYIYRALHDGTYGPFPTEGADNNDWKSIGKGYPIINDLYFRNQRVYEWGERSNASVGDFFIYHNPYNGDTEYFKLVKLSDYFPINKTSNEFWTYVGRYSKQEEDLTPPLLLHQWNESDRKGVNGSLYEYTHDSGKMYFILKTESDYWYFPTTPEDNTWWQFAGYYP